MKKMLCVTNVRLDDVKGRSYALKSRLELFERHGWEVEFFVLKHYHDSINRLGIFKKKVTQENFRFVWSMNNPFTLHLPPLFLKKLGVGFVWIAEFRDPMYLNPDPKKLKFIYRIIEKEVIREADFIVIPTGMQADLLDYMREYGLKTLDKFLVLPFAGLDNERCANMKYNIKLPFIITYAGSFYKDWIEPLTFLYGFKIYIEQVGLPPDHIQVYFFGDWNRRYEIKVRELKLKKYIKVWGWLKRSDLAQHFQNSDLFLHIAGSLPLNKKNISFKIWDYLCFARPILALCGKDYIISEFILKNKFGYVADYNDPEDVAEKLLQAHSDFETGEIHKIIRVLLQNRRKFDRKYHDEVFVQLCNTIYNEYSSKII